LFQIPSFTFLHWTGLAPSMGSGELMGLQTGLADKALIAILDLV
jgi:uncharacterized membrane protein (Fun14 family)